jgi:tRNA dimethylallyltransferase
MASAKKNKTVVIVVGPTAVGKTAVAIGLAKHFRTGIMSADSRQCYKELNIGVARPSEEELSQVPHHFIASHSIHDNVTAATFEQFALEKVDELFQKKDIVIMTGGTGLYIKAFVEGLDEIPEVAEEIRKNIITRYESGGIEWLQREVEKKDPVFFQKGEVKNPQRLMRALEVIEATGKSILDFRKGKKVEREFNIVKVGLELPKERLHQNIQLRVDRMVEGGLVAEVKSLLPWKNLNALQTVGYSEIFEFLEGKIPLEQAKEKIRKNTRQYAKRQMTWFKKDKDIRWFAPDDFEKLKEHLDDALSV